MAAARSTLALAIATALVGAVPVSAASAHRPHRRVAHPHRAHRARVHPTHRTRLAHAAKPPHTAGATKAPHAGATNAPHSHAQSAGGACANADAVASQSSAGALRSAVVCLINRERTDRRLPALHALRRLDRSAQSWTGAMVSERNFSHMGAGSDPGSRVTAAGYDWSAVGENIATGFATPRQVVAAWMASTDHCHNILDPQYTDVGTGVVAAPVAGFASGAATWTQDFGLPADASPPSGNAAPANGCPYHG
jgi:uncharacterized protein YkwD